MKIDRITITGVDDSVTADDLITLSTRFPFVEWGVLFSRSSHGTRPRYPSSSWLTTNIPALGAAGVQLSAHLCGGWVPPMVYGAFPWRDCYGTLSRHFQRLQLNFAGVRYSLGNPFGELLEGDGRQFILQVDGVNDGDIMQLVVENGLGVPLFDRSGGRGQKPATWQMPWPVYCGYAGGLGPDNIVEQIAAFELTPEFRRDQPFWLDMESSVRSPQADVLAPDLFDLVKVASVLEQVAPLIATVPVTPIDVRRRYFLGPSDARDDQSTELLDLEDAVQRLRSAYATGESGDLVAFKLLELTDVEVADLVPTE